MSSYQQQRLIQWVDRIAELDNDLYAAQRFVGSLASAEQRFPGCVASSPERATAIVEMAKLRQALVRAHNALVALAERV